jgi:ABC-type multidrug transport system ATPase subunit
LALRKTGGEISGEVYVNGQKQEKATWDRIVGYCEQQDIHIGTATVQEALEFSAALRLPTSVDQEARQSFVREILSLLELSDLADQYVGYGDQAGGLTSEQRKRLTIAVELVANPSILFLDEPTSGLDARAADNVMTAISKVVQTGRTVICTIHQPSVAIFRMFDKLLLLKRGGHTCYMGDLGEKCQSMINYFLAIPNCPSYPAGLSCSFLCSCPIHACAGVCRAEPCGLDAGHHHDESLAWPSTCHRRSS